MAAHQFTLTGTKDRQIARTRKKRNGRLSTLAAQQTQESLEQALANQPDPLMRELVFGKMRPLLPFEPHPNTLFRAFAMRAVRDEVHLLEAILQVRPEERRGIRDLLLPLCPWTLSADATQAIEDALPSGIVTPDGAQPDEARTITLTDVP